GSIACRSPIPLTSSTPVIPRFLMSPCYIHSHALHSFPTRRSSDLDRFGVELDTVDGMAAVLHRHDLGVLGAIGAPGRDDQVFRRSEEHTSELQSRFDLVCRLLLEKKNKPSADDVLGWTRASRP